MMDVVAVGLVAAGFLVVITGWLRYLASIPKNQVAERTNGSIALEVAGGGLAIAGVFLGAGPVWIVLGSFSILMSVFFLLLYTQRKTPVGDIEVEVGDRLLPFQCRDSEGERFHTESLVGRRILLKFFRGHW